MDTWPPVLKNLVLENLYSYERFVWFPDCSNAAENALLDAVSNHDVAFVRVIRKSVANIDHALQFAININDRKVAETLLMHVKDPKIGMYASILCNAPGRCRYHFEKIAHSHWLNLESEIYTMHTYAKKYGCLEYIQNLSREIGDEIDELIFDGEL